MNDYCTLDLCYFFGLLLVYFCVVFDFNAVKCFVHQLVVIIMFDFEAGEIVTPYIVHTIHSVQCTPCIVCST